ncbi:MAG TPA: hypothetical protein IAC19_06545 [Candidatus Ventricola gallistercoris]|nr:hypothetical protein [Candidatus Ventricola gallistercoris]
MNAITPNLSKPSDGFSQQQAIRLKLPIAKQPKALYNDVVRRTDTRAHLAYCAY